MFPDPRHKTIFVTGCIHFQLAVFALVNYCAICVYGFDIPTKSAFYPVLIILMIATGVLSIKASQSPERKKILLRFVNAFNVADFICSGILLTLGLIKQHSIYRHLTKVDYKILIASVEVIIMSLEIIVCIFTLIFSACHHPKKELNKRRDSAGDKSIKRRKDVYMSTNIRKFLSNIRTIDQTIIVLAYSYLPAFHRIHEQLNYSYKGKMFPDARYKIMFVKGCIQAFLGVCYFANFIAVCLYEVNISNTYILHAWLSLSMIATGVSAIKTSKSPETNKGLGKLVKVVDAINVCLSTILLALNLNEQHFIDRPEVDDKLIIAIVQLLILSLALIVCILSLISSVCYHLKDTRARRDIGHLRTNYNRMPYILPSNSTHPYSLPESSMHPCHRQSHTSIQCELPPQRSTRQQPLNDEPDEDAPPSYEEVIFTTGIRQDFSNLRTIHDENLYRLSSSSTIPYSLPERTIFPFQLSRNITLPWQLSTHRTARHQPLNDDSNEGAPPTYEQVIGTEKLFT